MINRRSFLEFAAASLAVPARTWATSSTGNAAADAGPYLGLVELTRLLHRKQLSPVEVVKAQFARIASLDGALHGYIRLTEELALMQARIAEKAILAGDIKGPLHGAPLGVKDIIWTRDAVTAAGSSLYANYRPPENAACVDRLLGAGAILLGKLTTTEFAGATYDPSIPMPLNPWNQSLWAGASSSGSGVSLAAGLCYGALGTDTGGSVRFPAAMDGIVGFKPTWGRISARGIFQGVPSMDHIGPMARNVEDVSALFKALVGPDSKDPRTSNRPLIPYSLSRRGGLKGLRVGIDPTFGLNDADEATAQAVTLALDTLKHLGARIVTVPFPDRSRVNDSVLTIAGVEGINYKGPPEGPPASADQYRQAVEWRSRFTQEVAQLFERIDILVTPVVPAAVLVANGMEKLEIDPEMFKSILRYVVPFDLTGSPALVQPAAVNEKGGPIAVQFVAQRFRDDLVLQAGYAFEQAMQWHRKNPWPVLPGVGA